MLFVILTGDQVYALLTSWEQLERACDRLDSFGAEYVWRQVL